jgi:Family of unknown function (DUF5675)
MNLTLQRRWLTPLSTSGELSAGDAATYFTLEPPMSPNTRGLRCIPAGTYKVIIAPSPRFGRDMPRLLDVPGWPNNDVLIHWGNYPDDTEGCILVGRTREDDFVGGSKAAFADLYPKLEAPAAAGDLTVTVVDAVADDGLA